MVKKKEKIKNKPKEIEQDYNNYVQTTTKILDVLRKGDYTNFEAFIILEGVRQSINTDIIHTAVRETLKGLQGNINVDNIFQNGKVGVGGPYQ